ncbi:aminotransferase class I/II-fold pyridoxal phosphate-dependent enzyme [Paenarthrobacter histidinolovorans]|uniref:aminotransferase class I/II-fold pyridoxal phosphate-dependent enzyme n=1 Tax=Paenarthrobacter histidinolovorans TaxID=43664 RepID=UPI0016643C21|nr:ornithine decarboxylase [Paenarthrobacter histidinolovorans]GGJ39967.1 amino acid decarboxylase [Paenarthrobacter histidinolovorans]
MTLNPPQTISVSTRTGTPESAWRTRRDAWEFLGYALNELVQNRLHGESEGSMHDVDHVLELLASLEPYWALPGAQTVQTIADLVAQGRRRDALEHVEAVNDLLGRPETPSQPSTTTEPNGRTSSIASPRPAIEVLVIDDGPTEETEHFKRSITEQRRDTDGFSYEINVVPSVEDALVALTINPNIQACILCPRFSLRTNGNLSAPLRTFVERRMAGKFALRRPIQRILELADVIAAIRPELDVYLVAGVAMESLAGSLTGRFRRIFARTDAADLHLSILGGIMERYETPFFTALQEHSRRPGSVFHALPISRGGSVQNSPWISDLVDFYGTNLLMAETSATSGGLDSLLDPHGSIKEAQQLASRAFRSHRTYFVTNGTSTANKIVHQSIVAPGDIVLVDRNCHKSHHYALVLAGASVTYLDAYPLDDHSLYGAVPLEEIKRKLLTFRRQGQLHRVKMLTLTNCTFDGIVYDPRKVMEECLAIKPDLVFLWDEAWFAFAGAHPVYRQRTAMQAAADLEHEFANPAYARRHDEQARSLAAAEADDDTWQDTPLIADPRTARLRVYATQSTHKTLTSLRQGSMIHVFDQEFVALNGEAFREAFMTHTSTSPNYQILASLDIGRRQVELEGYALVQKQADLAVTLSTSISRHPLLRKYFKILTTHDLVPARFRQTHSRNPAKDGLGAWDESWTEDEFVVDPSRITLDIRATGIDGDTFKHEYLMDKHSIQVNKTSRTNVLFMTNVGTSRSSVAYLIEVLVKIAEQLEREKSGALYTRQLKVVTQGTPTPTLPHFSRFAEAFQTAGELAGDMRSAYYLAYKPGTTEYLRSPEIRERMLQQDVISARFVTPYPPGFPVLVPGQIFSAEILDYMDALDTREVHGYQPQLGYSVFTTAALGQHGFQP